MNLLSIARSNVYIYLRKTLHDNAVYAKQKKTQKQNEEPSKVVEPKEVPKQLAGKDGLGKAYAAAHGVAIIDTALYIAWTNLGIAIHLYNDITKGADALACCS